MGKKLRFSPHVRWSDQDKAFLAEACERGVTVREIAAHLGRPCDSIKNQMRRMGLAIHKEPYPKLDMIKAYRNGSTLQEISRTFHVDTKTARRIITKEVEIRRTGDVLRSAADHREKRSCRNARVARPDGGVDIIVNSTTYGRLITTVSDQDADRVLGADTTWFVHWSPTAQGFYAMGKIRINGRTRSMLLHRWIMRPTTGMVVDHINHDTLDNRRSNLRIVTQIENMQNRRGINRNNTSGARNVYRNKYTGNWSVCFGVHRHPVYVGTFRSKRAAVAAARRTRPVAMPFSQG